MTTLGVKYKFIDRLVVPWISMYRGCSVAPNKLVMGLLPDTWNCGLCMRRECRELFPATDFKGNRYWVSVPGMHHGTCVTYVPWCISESPTRGGGENVPGIPGACATCNFTYLARGPWRLKWPMGWNYLSHSQTSTVQPLKFIPHFIMDVITYPWWD